MPLIYRHMVRMDQPLGLMRTCRAVLHAPGHGTYMKSMSMVSKPWFHPPPPAAAAEDRPAIRSLRQGLLHGYRPDIRTTSRGREAKAALMLAPYQKICYYPGKLHGGYQAFLLDQLFADCCQPALTANLSIDYLRPTPPETTLLLEVWPAKTDGRKIFMEGSVMIPEKTTGQMVPAARAKALFIIPKNQVT